MPKPRSLPALRGSAAARGKAVPLRKLKRIGHVALEIAAVVDDIRHGPVRHGRRRHQVTPAQLGRVDPQFARGGIDQPLDLENHLGVSRAAIRTGRHRVREHRLDFVVGGRQPIDACNQLGAAEHRHDAARPEIGAEIDGAGDAQSQEPAFAVERELRPVDLVAALDIADETFAPVRDPLHRTADAACRPQHQRFFRIGDILGAEAAADIAGDDANALRRNAEHVAGKRAFDRVRLAGGRVERVALGRRIIGTDIAARLDRIGRQPRIDEIKPRHVMGFRKGRVHGCRIALAGS